MDTILRFIYKTSLFLSFVTLVTIFISFLFKFIPSPASMIDNECVLHFFYTMGAPQALEAFFKILIIGFVGKRALEYIRNM